MAFAPTIVLAVALAAVTSATLMGPIPYYTFEYNATRVTPASAQIGQCAEGWLVTPYSAEVQESLTDALPSRVSLGGASGLSGRWSWSAGPRVGREFPNSSGPSELGFEAWLPGEPSTTSGCLAYEPPPANGWTAISCLDSLPFVCQRPLQTQLRQVPIPPGIFTTRASIEQQVCASVSQGWLATFVTVGHNAALRDLVGRGQLGDGLAVLGGSNAQNLSEMRWTSGPLAREANTTGRRFFVSGRGFVGAQEYTLYEGGTAVPPSIVLAEDTCIFLRLPSLALVLAPCADVANVTHAICEHEMGDSSLTSTALTFFGPPADSADRPFSAAESACFAAGGSLATSQNDLTYQTLTDQLATTWLSGRRNTTTGLTWLWYPPASSSLPFYNNGMCFSQFVCHWNSTATTIDPARECMRHVEGLWFGSSCADPASFACEMTMATELTVVAGPVENITTACGDGWPATLTTFEHILRFRELVSGARFRTYFTGGTGSRQQEWSSGPLTRLSGQTPFSAVFSGQRQCLGLQQPCSFEPSFGSGQCVAIQSSSLRFLRVDCNDPLIAGIVCETFAAPTTATPLPSTLLPAESTGLSAGAIAAAVVVPVLVVLLVLALFMGYYLRRTGVVDHVDEDDDDMANYVYEPLPSTPYATLAKATASAPAALRSAQTTGRVKRLSAVTGRHPSATAATPSSEATRPTNEQLRFSIPSDANPTDYKRPLTRKDGRKYKSRYVSPPARLSDEVLEKWGLPPLPPEDEDEKKKREQQRQAALDRRMRKLKERRDTAEKLRVEALRRQDGQSDDDEDEDDEETEEGPPSAGTSPKQNGVAPARGPPTNASDAAEDEELGDLLAVSFPGLAAVDEGEQIDD